MASIVFNNVHFSYPAAATPVFEDLSLVLDTGWRPSTSSSAATAAARPRC